MYGFRCFLIYIVYVVLCSLSNKVSLSLLEKNWSSFFTSSSSSKRGSSLFEKDHIIWWWEVTGQPKNIQHFQPFFTFSFTQIWTQRSMYTVHCFSSQFAHFSFFYHFFQSASFSVVHGESLQFHIIIALIMFKKTVYQTWFLFYKFVYEFMVHLDWTILIFLVWYIVWELHCGTLQSLIIPPEDAIILRN